MSSGAALFRVRRRYTERMGRTAGVRIRCLVFVLLAAAAGRAAGEGPSFESAPPGGKWTVVTRWDYRVRLDGEYLGFANRELREVYGRAEDLPGGWRIEGEARLLGATKKNGVPVAARLEGSEAVSYVLGRTGAVSGAEAGYPRLRGFPTFPEGELQPGDSWEAPLEILVYGPRGEKGTLRQEASYRYVGRRPYMGREAHYFDVAWAVRYRGYDPSVASFLKDVEGSHRVSLVMDAETGGPIMARDSLSERWVWADSRVEQRDGFALIFWEGVPPLDTGGVRREFEERFPGLVAAGPPGGGPEAGSGGASDGGPGPTGRDGGGGTTGGETTGGGGRSDGSEGSGGDPSGRRAGSEGLIVDLEDSALDEAEREGIVIVETPRGVSVTLRNLHFKPDLAELLPGEEGLLDELAAILKGVPERTVLVRGHTADVGRPGDEQALSEERARTVADEMAARGVDPRRLIDEGVGAREPAASNATEGGKRLNRRVEFLILED